MAVTPLKAFLFAGGGLVAAAGVAYVSGALDPYFNPRPPAEVAALNPPAASAKPADVSPGTGVHDVTPPPTAAKPAEAATPPAEGKDAAAPAADAMKPAAPATDAMKPAEPNAPETNAMKPAAPAAEEAGKPAQSAMAAPATPPAAATGPVAPTFDVVRVEENGSVVVAGNAAPNARVDIVNGETVIGSTTAGPDGAFAIVLDDPLKPGDYQLLLRATTPDNAVVASRQTAVVSVPDKPGGQVLAMVEEPGKAAELMTVPEPEKQPESPAAANAPEANPPAADQAAKPAPAEASNAPAPAETVSKPAGEPAAAPAAEAKPAPVESQSPAAPAAGPKVVVEAVEIDGSKVFVAGIADPGRKVRAYANEILLGDGVASPDGHFLVEATRDLPVGAYTVRVDALDADGSKVVARATVPFEREPGESIAAVAPTEPKPAAPAAEQPAEIASAKPAEDAQKPAPATPPAVSQPAPAEAAQAPAAAPPANGSEPPPATAEAPAATPQPDQPSGQPATAAAPEQPAAPAAPAAEKPAEVAAATPPSDGVPETVSPKLEHSDGAVIIRRRDTLWHISRRVYGHGIRYSTIYLANQDQIADPDMIWPGQVFRVPEKSKEGETADLKALGEQATTAPIKTE
jgi:nucleoid-associated protein YgaU